MSQEERAVGYRYSVEQSAAHPALIGIHWFQWLDQPATGRGDGENYNIGFIDGTDQPYPEMVTAATLTHARLDTGDCGGINVRNRCESSGAER